MQEAKRLYVGWEEVVVSNDKGRRVVHYYLKGACGGADLAVVGREKSVRHMSYAVPNQFLMSLLARPHPLSASSSSPSSSSRSTSAAPAGFSFKWRSRREVIDWLSSLVSDSVTYGSSPVVDRYMENEDADSANLPDAKGLSSGKARLPSKEFSWLGRAWNSRKRRKHYRAFCRNGITVSVHDFVYIMSEENKRLIAYVEDLYEDVRANKMVVARWFHKVDEVGVLLPPDVNDREIFFSLCLQDFSVECIDGLAAVLSAQHYEQFQNEAKHSKWEPYLCRRQIDNDDIKPFDVTQVQGYWSQELLRSMFSSPLKLRLKITCGNSGVARERSGVTSENVSLRNLQLEMGVISTAEAAAEDKFKPVSSSVSSKTRKYVTSTLSGSALLRKELFKQKLHRQFCPGSHVEVLSQDSGIRGCWFRCVILKRHQDKVKVRYQDVKDADEIGNLEEWILLSRVAAPDKLGIRMRGRPMVRPHRSQRGKMLCNFSIGAIVDAWWHDGWWEGIVIHKESEGQLHIYFPGEKRASIFSQVELRQSQDWVSNKWNIIEVRKDIAFSLLSDMKFDNKDLSDNGQILVKLPVINDSPRTVLNEHCSATDKFQDDNTSGYSSSSREGEILDLTRYCQFDSLKWCSLKKRKRGRELTKVVPAHNNKRQCQTSSSSSQDMDDSNACGGFILPKSLSVDHENCKVGGDPLFSAPMTLTSLVVSQ